MQSSPLFLTRTEITMAAMHRYNVGILGDVGVGKSSFVRKLKELHFDQRYTSTVGCEVHPLVYDTTAGEIFVHLWDFSGNDKYAPHIEPILDQMDFFIIIYSYDVRNSYRSAIEYWWDKIRGVPTIFLQNKIDIRHKYKGVFGQRMSCKDEVGPPIDIITGVLRKLTADPKLLIMRW